MADIELRTKSGATDSESEPFVPRDTPFQAFWKVWGETVCISSVVGLFLVVYITLLSVSIQQAQSAEFAPESFLNNPTASNDGWELTKAYSPYAAYGPTEVTQNSHTSVLFNDTLRLEVKFAQFTPQPTGATASISLRMVLPQSWMDTTSNPSTPLWSSSCSFGNAQITVTPKSTGSSAFDTTYNNYQITTGTNLEYPFDNYAVTSTVYCYYYSDTNNKASIYPTDNYINFDLAIDKSDVGFFTKTTSYTPPTVQNVTVEADDDYHRIYSALYFVLPEMDLTFNRAPINQVFPMYIVIAMWLIITGETLVFFPYYISKKNVDAPGTVMGAVGILFALPNIRNTLPGAPQVGAVIDFAAYFWCLIIAISHFFAAAVMWVRFSVVLPNRAAAAKNLKL